MQQEFISTEQSTMYITTDQEGSYEVPPAKSPDRSFSLNRPAKIFFIIVVMALVVGIAFGAGTGTGGSGSVYW